MPINPLVALQGTSLNTAPAVNQLGQNIALGRQLDRQEEQDQIANEERAKNDELRNLQIAREKFGQFSDREQQRISSSVQGALQLNTFIENGDIDGAREYLTNRKQRLSQAQEEGVNVDTVETDEALELLESNPELLKQNLDGLIDAGNKLGILESALNSGNAFAKGSGVVVKQKDGTFAQAIPVFDKSSGQVQNKLVPLDGQPVSRLGETGFDQTNRLIIQAGESARASEEAKTEAIPDQVNAQSVTQRNQGFIDAGFEAADALPVIKRGLELLDSIKTGGFASAQLRAKQTLGIEGADEAELSNSLGKSVLSQLRTTFGAAFTENEGKRLADIEAGFGKSTEGNRRLLEQADKITTRAVKRAIRAARKSGDEDTVEELEEAMNFSLSPEADQAQDSTDLSNVSDDDLLKGF